MSQIVVRKGKETTLPHVMTTTSSSSFPLLTSTLTSTANSLVKDQTKPNYALSNQILEKQKRINITDGTQTTTKRAKIELHNGTNHKSLSSQSLIVQNMIKKIKEDFQSYFIVNEKLRKGILQKVLCYIYFSHYSL